MDYHIYKKAKKRVKDKRKFYSHAITWAIMSVFFILLNIFTTNRTFWAIFPILGWGIGLAFHGIKVFSTVYGDDWEERAIEKEMEKLRKSESSRSYMEDDRDKMILDDIKKVKEPWRDSDFV